MADSKLTALTNLATVSADDLLYVVDDPAGAAASRKATAAVLATYVVSTLSALSPQVTALNLGHATDTTLTRYAAGQIQVEGADVVLSTNICSVPPITGNIFVLSEVTTLSTLAAMVQNQIYWSAVTVQRRVTISGLGARVVANNAGNFQLALYRASAAGKPTGSELCKTGNLSTASAGLVTGSLAGGNYTIDPGTYFLGLNVDNTVATFTGSATSMPPYTMSQCIGSSTGEALGANTGLLGYITPSITMGTWGDMTSATMNLNTARHVAVVGIAG